MIEARGLTKSFGGRPAIVDVSLQVERGEVLGFLGPNGAGKTTTMRILLGTLRPDAGTVSVSPPVGYMPETFSAYDVLSVRSYLRFIARLKRADDVERAIDRAAIADLIDRPVERLSKGQRQRVGLAQALLGSPASFILDEPTIGLDPRQVVEMRRVIADLRDDAAVLVSTHILAEAVEMCDRVAMIVDGRIVAIERPTPDLEERFLRLAGELP